MFITCIIDPSVYGVSSLNEDKRIIIDIDPHDEVENVIILVTLKLTEIDPSNLQVFYKNKKVPSNTKILSMKLEPDDYFLIKKASSGCCCLLF